MNEEFLRLEGLADNVAITQLSMTIAQLRTRLPDASDDTLEEIQRLLNGKARQMIADARERDEEAEAAAEDEALRELDGRFGYSSSAEENFVTWLESLTETAPNEPAPKTRLLRGTRVQHEDGTLGMILDHNVDKGLYKVAWDDEGMWCYENDDLSEMDVIVSD